MKPDSIKTIIVDDEQKCIANLCHYLSKYCPLLKVIGTGSTPAEAQHLFKICKPEVAFLDIELCNDNIFSILNMQQLNAKVIFVTAYEKYAIKAIKADALDYILKPLSRDDVTECYEKILKQLQNTAELNISADTASHSANVLRKVILRQGEHVFIVKQTDIYYFHAKGFYTEVFFDFKGKSMCTLVSKPLNIIEKEYNASVFFRLHKSYIVNTNKVEGIIKGNTVTIKLSNGDFIPVAKRRLNDFLLAFNE